MEQDKPKMGQKIDLRSAQEMIDEYLTLNSNVVPTIKEDVKANPNLQKKMEVFIMRKHNAFVFTKDLLMRFFDGSEEDADGNPQSANYLVVILGAHKEKKTIGDQNFESGSFTVLTAGCTRKTEIDKNGKKVIKFYPLSTPRPANEYPPTTTVTLKPGGINRIDGNGFDYLEVI